MEKYVSRQQINELRLLVLQVVNKWYDLMCLDVEFGKDEDILLENCSPKLVRRIVVKYFGRKFRTKDGFLDLQASRYEEAKRFVKSIELEPVRSWALKNGLIEVLPEARPSSEDIRRRLRQSWNTYHARHGSPQRFIKRSKSAWAVPVLPLTP